MFERDVTVNLNADVSSYTSSLSQAIAITQQYSSAADSALGTVAKLSAGMIGGLTKITSGITGPQKMVTDAAAAYQQQLSGLQASSAVTGQSFGQLEKSTRALARSFPIGMTQAVQQVQALQSAGVTSNKEIERLAVSFTKLGAANNSFGPELGQQMLQVTRAFGNGTAQIDALGDSLTTVSKKWGASATGILTFSKAIAPIASTVGMSQTQVMGLSAAMSRLDEDGYMAGNAINKFILDLNKGVRQGGPELKVYADLLNMTSESLKNLFKSNPTEALVQFTEAVAKRGPDAQRTLELLGMDGVRTTRSITALSRSGDLREIVATSVGAYGNGSTNKAAEEVFSGVNDQMTMLSESMRQTVASAGKPYLSFMEDVLKVGRGVSEVTNKVMQNDGVQTLATAGIIGGVGASLLFKGLAATSIGSMAMNLLRSGRDSSAGQAFRDGRQLGRMGYTPANMPQGGGASGLAGRMGAFVGNVQGPAPSPSAAQPSYRERVMGRIDDARRFAQGAAVRVMDADRNSMAAAGGRPAPVPITPQGAAFRAAAGDLARNPSMAALRSFGAAAGDYARAIPGTTGAMGAIGRTGLYVGEAARTASQGLIAAGKGVGRFVGGLGISPAMAAVAGVGVTGYLMYRAASDTNQRLEGVRSGSSTDIYSAFNQFAEATGMAGKGLVDFTAAVSSATQTLSRGNTTFEQAGLITDEEAMQATSPGYQRVFNIIGDARSGGSESVRPVAQQIIATMGRNASPEMVDRAVRDVANEVGIDFAREVGKVVTDYYVGGGDEFDGAASLRDIASNASMSVNPYQTSEEASQLALLYGRSRRQESYERSQVSGDEAGAISNLSVARETFLEAQRVLAEYDSGPAIGLYPSETGESRKANELAANVGKILQGQLNISEDAMAALFPDGVARPEDFANGTFEYFFRDQLQNYANETGRKESVLNTFDLADARDIDIANPSYETFWKQTEPEKRAFALQEAFVSVTGRASTVSEALYGIVEAARTYDMTLKDLAGNAEARANAGLDSVQQLVLDAVADMTDPAKVNKSAEAVARRALEQADNNTVLAISRLKLESAQAEAGTPQAIIAQAAADYVSRPAEILQAGIPQTRLMLQQYRQGQAAQQMGYLSTDPDAEAARQADVASGQQTQAAFTSMARNFLLQQRQMEVQMQQMREQSGQQTYQMQRDYNLQVQYANEDFQTGQMRATRDFNISMGRMERDYQTGRRRATRDFQTQSEYAEQDYNRSKRRAQQDYNTQSARAEQAYQLSKSRTEQQAAISTERMVRDYQKSRWRVVRDALISGARMEEDYEKQRTRATESFERSKTRAVADYTLARGRATRDFERQQGYAQADYEKSRLRAAEDFNKQLRRLTEDQAKSLYDPYKRIQAQLVMDAGQLVVNLADQNKALARQMESVDKLKSLGLSQQAIDVLGLSDVKNAQQVERLLADVVGDPAMLERLNAEISGRLDLTNMFVTDEDNQQARRMYEDFNTQMSRMEQDFVSASKRAAEQFETSMSDMAEDFVTQMLRAQEDFDTSMSNLEEDYKQAVARAAEDLQRGLLDMQEDHQTALADAAADLALVLSQMAQDYAIAAGYAEEDFNRAMQRMDADYERMVERSLRQFNRMMRDMARDFRKARRDARQDFATEMEDSQADFDKQMRRMATSLENALSDIGAGLALAERTAAQSLIAYGQTVAQGEEAIFRDFGTYIASLPKDLQDEMGESVRGLLHYMKQRFPGMFKEIFPNGIAGILPPEALSLIPPWARGAPHPESDQGTAPAPAAPDPGDPYIRHDFETVGELAGEGFLEGLKRAIQNGQDLVRYAAGLVIDWWKKRLGISSPSKVFMNIGKDTIQGFIDGILDALPTPSWIKDKIAGLFAAAGTWLSNVDTWVRDKVRKGWDELVKDMPNVKEAVQEAFKTVGDWISDLGGPTGWIADKIGNAWNKLTANMPNVKEAVQEAFKAAGDWLSDLGGPTSWIADKIGNAWNKLTAAIPDGRTIKESVVGSFSQLGTWLSDFDGWVKRALPSWYKLVDSFKAMFVAPAEAAVNSLIQKWNSFRLEIGPLEIEVAGRKIGTFGPWYVDTPDMDPVNWYAQGGIVSGAQIVGVGEAGPEAIVPLNERGARVMADALKTYLDETVWGGSLSGLEGGAQVITVEMADLFLDFTDSGSEFSEQAQGLLLRIREAAEEAHSVMTSAGSSISKMIDELTDDIEGMAVAMAESFGGSSASVTGDVKSITEGIGGLAEDLVAGLGLIVDAIDTDLASVTSGFETSVTAVIDQMDLLIEEAIERIEDFANRAPGGGGCLLYTSPSPRDLSTSRMPSSA